MAKIGRKRTTGQRVDPDFKELVDNLARFKAQQEKISITPSRITQAMFKQYKNHPDLIEEIKKSKLGKWKSR